MFGLFALATLAWITALVYYRFVRISKEEHQNTLGFKYVAVFLASFALMIFAFKFLTSLNFQENSPQDSQDSQSGTGLSFVQWSVIAFLALLLWIALFSELSLQIKGWLSGYSGWQLIARLFLAVFLAFLILTQIFSDNVVLNNLFLFFVVAIIIELAVRLKRGAFAMLFSLIMLLDIYLVWMAAGSSGQGSESAKSWYVAMFQSEFMQYFPFPLGFRWGERILGNGDVAFTCLTVMYARRVWGVTPAIISGIAATLPLLLLPFAVKILEVSPPAWPYTIFIAPVALVIAIFAPHKPKQLEQTASA